VDYELELGAFVGPGNRRGEMIAIEAAEDHLFGVCLLNDWSARDVQAWESVPLGPFQAKNFITSVSPWVVTLEALAPYRCQVPREAGDPPTLPHLSAAGHPGGIDIQLEAWLETADGPATRLSHTSYRHAYWSLAQLVAHHTGNGCNLRPGDLLGTGTQSGPGRGEEGCLLELSRGGREPVPLPGGQVRRYLNDGDTVVLRGWCEREGFAGIGLGECRGTVLPARTNSLGTPSAPPPR
jgi:fumarylacetoacetase